MSDDVVAYQVSKVRGLLLKAFTDRDLRYLVHDTSNPELRPLQHELGSGDNLATMVDKTITYCEKRGLLPDLLDEVKRERPRQYARLEPSLRTSPATFPTAHVFLDPAAVAAYLKIVRVQCSRRAIPSVTT